MRVKPSKELGENCYCFPSNNRRVFKIESIWFNLIYSDTTDQQSKLKLFWLQIVTDIGVILGETVATMQLQ
jgi:hypothetical protein